MGRTVLLPRRQLLGERIPGCLWLLVGARGEPVPADVQAGELELDEQAGRLVVTVDDRGGGDDVQRLIHIRAAPALPRSSGSGIRPDIS